LDAEAQTALTSTRVILEASARRSTSFSAAKSATRASASVRTRPTCRRSKRRSTFWDFGFRWFRRV